MTISMLVVGVVLFTMVAYFAIQPILIARQAQRVRTQSQATRIQAGQAHYQRLLGSIIDLDFDYDTGKIDDNTYIQQRITLIE